MNNITGCPRCKGIKYLALTKNRILCEIDGCNDIHTMKDRVLINILDMKKIIINFPNGEKFELPAKVIAEMRTEYYSNVDGYKKGSKEWDEEFKLSMDSFELRDWIMNNTDWEDIAKYAKKVGEIKPLNYADMWNDVEIEC